MGGANLDVLARSIAPAEPGTSNPGSTTSSPGGVGRNVAEHLARLGTTTHLVAAVGDDRAGEALLAATEAAGVRTEHVVRTAERTGSYTAVLDHDGELVVAVADMGATDLVDAAAVARAEPLVARAGLLVLDGNVGLEALRAALDLGRRHGVPVVLDPVSAPKSRRLAGLLDGSRRLHTLTPNVSELSALVDRPVGDEPDELEAAAAELHARGVEHVWVRRGRRGSLLCSAGVGVSAESGYAAVTGPVVDVTGAGDAMLAAYCHTLLAGHDLARAVEVGHLAAALTVTSPHTVRPDLAQQLDQQLGQQLDLDRSPPR